MFGKNKWVCIAGIAGFFMVLALVLSGCDPDAKDEEKTTGMVTVRNDSSHPHIVVHLVEDAPPHVVVKPDESISAGDYITWTDVPAGIKMLLVAFDHEEAFAHSCLLTLSGGETKTFSYRLHVEDSEPEIVEI